MGLEEELARQSLSQFKHENALWSFIKRLAHLTRDVARIKNIWSHGTQKYLLSRFQVFVAALNPISLEVLL